MKLSGLPENRIETEYLTAFGGYNHRPFIAGEEFFDMKNMSGKDYPLAATRPKRGELPLMHEGQEITPIGTVGMDQLLCAWIGSGGAGYRITQGVDATEIPDYTRSEADQAKIDLAAQTTRRVLFTPDTAFAGSDGLQRMQTLMTGLSATERAPYNCLYSFRKNGSTVNVTKHTLLTPSYDADSGQFFFTIDAPQTTQTLQDDALYAYIATNPFADQIYSTDLYKYLKDNRLKLSAFTQALIGAQVRIAPRTPGASFAVKSGTRDNYIESTTITNIRQLNAIEAAAVGASGYSRDDLRWATFDRVLHIEAGLGIYVRIGQIQTEGGTQTIIGKSEAAAAAQDVLDKEARDHAAGLYSEITIGFEPEARSTVAALTAIEYAEGQSIAIRLGSMTEGVNEVTAQVRRPHQDIPAGYERTAEPRILLGEYNAATQAFEHVTNLCAAKEGAPHKLVRMGAQLILWPEKYMVNTAVQDEVTGVFTDIRALEQETVIRDATRGAGGTWQYQMCDYQGSVYDQTATVGATAPAAPSTGALWLDTSGKTPQWKQWSGTLDCWNDIACYVKLRAAALLQGGACLWQAGDAVELCCNGTLTALQPAEDQTHFVIAQAGTETVDGEELGYIVFLCNIGKVNGQGKVIFDNVTDAAECPDAGADEEQEIEIGHVTSGGVVKPNGTVVTNSVSQQLKYTSDESDQARQIAVAAGDKIRYVNSAIANKNMLLYGVCAYRNGIADANSGATEYVTDGCYLVPEGVDGIALTLNIPSNGTKALYRARSLRKLIIRRTVPEMDHVIECNNRLWGCRYGLQDGKFVNEIFACKQGDPTNWHYFGNTAMDSYFVSLGDPGPFTGAAAYHNGQQSNPIFFRQDKLHRIYGSYPANYSLQTVDCAGVAPGSARSLTTLNGLLYYHATCGIMAYSGYYPQLISAAFGDLRYRNAVAGAEGNEIYFALEAMDGTRALMVYDDRLQQWHKEDDLPVDAFVRHGNELYAISPRTGIAAMRGRAGLPEADFDFLLQSGEIGYATPLRKQLLKLTLRLRLAPGTRARLQIRYDDGAWIPCGELNAGAQMHSQALHIKPARCDHFALQISGHGALQLLSAAKYYEEGSDYD